VIIAGTIVAAVGCGLIAGLFYVFSAFAMRSLGRMEPQHGMTAMRNMNEDIQNPLFLLIFVGTALLCLALAVAALFTWDEPGSAWRLAGGLLYVVGSFGVTVVLNVPMNNRLAASDPATAEGKQYWREYTRRWTTWNHVRFVASTAALVALLLALGA
jgi:uncharacterized membrane protein